MDANLLGQGWSGSLRLGRRCQQPTLSCEPTPRCAWAHWGCELLPAGTAATDKGFDYFGGGEGGGGRLPSGKQGLKDMTLWS